MTVVHFNFREALLSVAQTFFENVDLGSEEIKVLFSTSGICTVALPATESWGRSTCTRYATLQMS